MSDDDPDPFLELSTAWDDLIEALAEVFTPVIDFLSRLLGRWFG